MFVYLMWREVNMQGYNGGSYRVLYQVFSSRELAKEHKKTLKNPKQFSIVKRAVK